MKMCGTIDNVFVEQFEKLKCWTVEKWFDSDEKCQCYIQNMK